MMRCDTYLYHRMIHGMPFFAVMVTPETIIVLAITVVVRLAMPIVILATIVIVTGLNQ